MAKKKLWKEDGSEDFAAEAAEPEETSEDAGNVSDMLKGDSKGDDLGKTDAGAAAPADSKSDKDASTTGGDASVATDAEAPSDASATSASGQADTSASSAQPAPASDASAAAEPPPELAEVHPEAQAAVDVSPEVSEILKEAANKLTPVLSKFQELEEKIHELEDEAKNRFVHVRQKATEYVAALELFFKRG